MAMNGKRNDDEPHVIIGLSTQEDGEVPHMLKVSLKPWCRWCSWLFKLIPWLLAWPCPGT